MTRTLDSYSDKLYRKVNEVESLLSIDAFYIGTKELLITKLKRADLNSKTKQVVVYGLGSFSENNKSLVQLAFLTLLVKDLKITKVLCYDPVFSKKDREVLSKFQFKIMKNNTLGVFEITGVKTTLFYMPHCPLSLYNNVIASNWNVKQLKSILIIGNTIPFTNEVVNKKQTLKNAIKLCLELQILNVVSMPQYEKDTTIFNDTGFIMFRIEEHNATRIEATNPTIETSDLELIKH